MLSAATTLIGDVGGTNCRFALAEVNAQDITELHHSQRYAVKDYNCFEDAVTRYLSDIDIRPTRGAFAFALDI